MPTTLQQLKKNLLFDFEIWDKVVLKVGGEKILFLLQSSPIHFQP